MFEKKALTLAPIWLPHWPACRWTISLILQTLDELGAGGELKAGGWRWRAWRVGVAGWSAACRLPLLPLTASQTLPLPPEPRPPLHHNPAKSYPPPLSFSPCKTHTDCKKHNKKSWWLVCFLVVNLAGVSMP